MIAVHQPFHGDLLQGIYPEAERLGRDVLLSGTAPGRGEAKAVEALLSHRCEAVILLGSDAEPTDLGGLAHRTAVVSIGRRASGTRVDSVRIAEGKASGRRWTTSLHSATAESCTSTAAPAPAPASVGTPTGVLCADAASICGAGCSYGPV